MTGSDETIIHEEWERHRLAYERSIEQRQELEYVRAFVKRVQDRVAVTEFEWSHAEGLLIFQRTMDAELATMEAEVKN